MITTEIKQTILAAIRDNRTLYPSDARHAAALGISTSVYSAIKKGQTDRALSDANWLSIARRLQVSLRPDTHWNPAPTATFQYITAALQLSQQSSLSSILCDAPNIGKTFTARQYIKTHPNAIYVDCSQVKSKQQLVRFIAREFGLNYNGRYTDVYADLTFYLRSIDHPLIILDEAGDLYYEAFLELKALWNATEGTTGWYMMGADGLEAKIQRSINYRKVGFAELFSRYGGAFRKVTPQTEEERRQFLLQQALVIAKANAPADADPALIARRSAGSLRRVRTEIEKLRQLAATQ